MLTRPQFPPPEAKTMTFKANATTPKAKAKTKNVRILCHSSHLIKSWHCLAKHLEISSNSYIQRITHMQMLVACCHTSLLHFKYMSVSSNESDMRA